MNGWTKLVGVVSVLVGLSTLFLQRDALSTQLPQAVRHYLPAALFSAARFRAGRPRRAPAKTSGIRGVGLQEDWR